jgi:hypothetical protein
MSIHWTKEALAELTPRRGEAKPPRLDYDEAALRREIALVISREQPKFERGVKKKLADHALVTDVLEQEDVLALDARLQGARIVMIRSWGQHFGDLAHDLMCHWIVAGGLAFAVRAQYEGAIRRVEHDRSSGRIDMETSSVAGTAAKGWSLWGLKRSELRPVLSRAILAANEADYAAVVKVVGELRAGSSTSMRCDLSSLVPTERAWALEDVRAALVKKEHDDVVTTVDLFPALGRCDEARELLAELVKNPFALAPCVYDAVRELEDDAIPPLAAAMQRFEKEPPKANMGLAQAREMARALALFDDPRVVAAFLPWVGDAKTLGPIATAYMQQFPASAVHALAPRLLEKTKGAEPAQQLLARLARAHSSAVRDAAKDLPKDQQAAVEKLVAGGESVASGQAAPLADLPEVLRDPPWRRKGARPTLPVLEKLEAPSYDERVVWKSDAERTLAKEPPFGGFGSHALGASQLREKIAALAAESRDKVDYFRQLYIPWTKLEDDDALEFWNETPVSVRHTAESAYFSEVGYMLARFGVRAIPGAIASVTRTMYEQPFAWLMHCDSPRVAALALRGASRGALRSAAVAWMHAFPDAATVGLLPVALGPPSPQKMDAAAALRQHVDRSRLLAGAERFGAGVSAAIDAMLAFDPLFDCPKAPPKLSAFADPSTMPAVRLADGRVVPDDGKRNLLEMLQFTSFDAPYVGIAQARAALSPSSVDDLLRALLDAWVAAGAASASAWPLRAIGHMGSDAMARDLAAKIRKWPREKGRPRALLGVDALGRMGTDVALMHLFDLSKTAKNRHVEARASEVLVAAASSRGLTGEALEDRLIPSLDLDKDGRTTLDFGTRQLVVRIDEQLAPHVYDGDTRLPSLPRPAKTDDADKAKLAAARFKTLKSDLATLAKTLLWRFEHTMIKGRRWDAHEHRALLVDHPLAGRITRKLVWASFEGDAVKATFRVADDGALFDDDDKPFTLDESSRVGLPHPLHLDPARKTRWGQILADYEIIQPFEQITRATFAVDAKHRKKTSIDDFSKRELPYGVVFGRLEGRGWRRGEMEEGSISTLEKDFGPMSATLSFSPALFAREKPPEAVTIDDVSFGSATLGDVPAVAFSEAMYDLSVFAPK